MQWVDYYAGVPLCFIFDLLNRSINFLKGSSRAGDLLSGPVLFIELSEMGSAIIAYPALKKAIEKSGRDNVYFLIFEANRESVEILNALPPGNIITINSQNFLKFVASTIAALIRIRRLKISTCLDLELFSRCTALITYLSGARKRAGFHNYTEEGLYRGDLLTHPVIYNPAQHMAQNFLALLTAVDGAADERPLIKKRIIVEAADLPTFSPTEADLKIVSQIISENGINPAGRLFIINPDPGVLALRGWPPAYFGELAARITAADPANYVAVVGLKSSRRYFELIAGYKPNERIIDLTGKTDSLSELLALLSMSRCFITNDSGPAHMAAMLNINVIVLFGPETPVRYRPLGANIVSLFAGLACSPCFSAANHRCSPCDNNVCMQSISVDEVWEAVQQSANGRSSESTIR